MPRQSLSMLGFSIIEAMMVVAILLIVSAFAVFNTQSALRHEAAHGTARSRAAEASSVGDPGNRKAEAEPPFQAAVPQEMRIDGAVDHGKAQARHEIVFQVFPELFGVRFFVFHIPIQSGNIEEKLTVDG